MRCGIVAVSCNFIVQSAGGGHWKTMERENTFYEKGKQKGKNAANYFTGNEREYVSGTKIQEHHYAK